MFEIDKRVFPHYMLREIYEQPGVIRKTLEGRLVPEYEDIIIGSMGGGKDCLKDAPGIIIVACGTSYHAGLAGKYLIEKLAGVPVEAEMASEFRCKEPIVDEKDLVIAISQSGETSDTLDAMRRAKEKGARVFAVTNVEDSTLAKEADYCLYTCAGPEIAVASTKAYTSQLIALYLIALKIAYKKGSINNEAYDLMKRALSGLTVQAQKMLDLADDIKGLALKHKDTEKIIYLGSGLDYALALEGSLKLKETCYIHSAAYPIGEFRHGPIALVEKGLLTVFIATQDMLTERALYSLKAIKERGAYVIALAKEGNREIGGLSDRVIYIPDTLDEFTSVPAVVPLQLFAYYTAVAKGHDVDRPRSLVKSVTD